MNTGESIFGLMVFLVAGGGLRLYLERRSQPPASVESRFDVAALGSLAHRLVLGGQDVRSAAVSVADSVASPAAGTITEQDHQRLTYLIADHVYQLQTK